MKASAPIRFLVLLLAGWTGARLMVLAPSWWPSFPVAEADAGQARVVTGEVSARAKSADIPARGEPGAPGGAAHPGRVGGALRLDLAMGRPEPATPQLPQRMAGAAGAATATVAAEWRNVRSGLPGRENPSSAAWIQTPGALPPRASRLAGSAWVLLRPDGAAALAPGGTLGGSQAGLRLLYRLNDDPSRPLALSARLYAPLRGTRGAEAALGLDWRPDARLPVHLLVERRQRIGRAGRSAFAATAYGGGAAALGGGWRLDGYAQAGVVGLRSRDPFIDGSVRISRPLGPVEAGAAGWGAAQPGAARLDAGPQLSLPVRVRDGVALRVSAEYRFRILGDARPASGPSLTLGVDF